MFAGQGRGSFHTVQIKKDLSSTDGVSNTVVLIDTDTLKVVPCALANDGTALKPSIQFHPRTKLNGGLTLNVDATFGPENPCTTEP